MSYRFYFFTIGDTMSTNNTDNNDNRARRIARVILIIIAILMIIFGSIYFGYYLYSKYTAGSDNPVPIETTVADIEDTEAVKNPIDFATLQADNDEIYAWIKVPGTKVDYPLVQSKIDDNFYLKHSAYDKSYILSGAIFTQSANSLSFDDRVTVIYGHNSSNEKMFASLHRFESQEFFDKHDKFYIYTPTSRLTYKIVSAFKYDNRHIMNSFDFQDNGVFLDFLDLIQNPTSSNKNVRNDIDKQLTLDDNVVVLSTCIQGQHSSRLLVCGVLTKNEKTN